MPKNKKDKPIEVEYTHRKDEQRKEFAYSFINRHIQKNLDWIAKIIEKKK